MYKYKHTFNFFKPQTMTEAGIELYLPLEFTHS